MIYHVEVSDSTGNRHSNSYHVNTFFFINDNCIILQTLEKAVRTTNGKLIPDDELIRLILMSKVLV